LWPKDNAAMSAAVRGCDPAADRRRHRRVVLRPQAVPGDPGRRARAPAAGRRPRQSAARPWL